MPDRNTAGRQRMHSNKLKVRFWVVGPFLFYLAVFLLWFPRWQSSPNSASTRFLGVLFGAMTAVLAACHVIGAILYGSFTGLYTIISGRSPRNQYGWLIQTAIDAWDTFVRSDSTPSYDGASSRRASTLLLERPPLVVTKRLIDGTPIRGACPLCEVDFSTEAFADDPTYPHESTLDKWYGEHFECHLEES